jgi:50S ribosomal subunit-associated GTPase HflX
MKPVRHIGGRAIIAALVSAKATDTEERISALTSVLAMQGIEVVGNLVQRRGVSRAPSPGGASRLNAPMSSATFIGSGKVQELAALAKERSATVVYFLNDLSATQVARLSALTSCEIVPYPIIQSSR